MSRSNLNIGDPSLQIIRFQNDSELEHLKDVCAKIGITPSEMFSMHEGAFNQRPKEEQLRFRAARDLGDFFRRKYEASRKTRDLIRRKEIRETDEEFKKFIERRDAKRRGNASVTFSQKNIDETSRRKGGFDDNSIASHHTSQNSWVSNVSKSSYLGESILDCEGSIEEPFYNEPSDVESIEESWEFDEDFSFDTVDGSQFRPHHKLISTPKRNEAGKKAMFRNSDYENYDWAELSGMVGSQNDPIKIQRQGYCDDGFRSISGSGKRLDQRYWDAYQGQIEMESQMLNDDDEDDDSCPIQSSKFLPH